MRLADDANDTPNLDAHAVDAPIEAAYGGRFTPNHAAFTLIVVGLAGLWIIKHTMKGAIV